MASSSLIKKGRKAFSNQHWQDAKTWLTEADIENPLKPEDLEILALSCYLTGDFNACTGFLTRAYNELLNAENIPGAAYCAFWQGLLLINKGESVRGGGWIGKAKKLLGDNPVDCVEKGYLMIPDALKYLGEGDAERSLLTFREASEIAAQFKDNDLMALSVLGRGQALIRMGESQAGTAMLDEAMVAVDSENLSPVVVGIIYCAVIETCLEIFDLGRAQAWTEALSHWCSSHPHLVPFRGQCLTRRSEILLLHGEWQKAINEASNAVRLLSGSNGEPAAGAAYYQLGNLHRLRGEFSSAERCYNESSKFGRSPEPGFSLLRYDQGDNKKAMISIKRALRETKKVKRRAEVLLASVEILVEEGLLEEAKESANELTSIADQVSSPWLNAAIAQANGQIMLAENNEHGALDQLLLARQFWMELKAPFEVARTRMLTGLAYLSDGDSDAAEMEFEAAKWRFEDLNALPQLERLTALQKTDKSGSSGLTPREIEVLQLLAEGESNNNIAAKLFISTRTVERHVSNIFQKLNLTSRSAVTAYAFKHHLL